MILQSLGMLTCPIFGSTTGLFAAVLGKDIFSAPYYKVTTRKKNSSWRYTYIHFSYKNCKCKSEKG